MGDCLVCGISCYLVTDAVADEAMREDLKGAWFADVQVTLDYQFEVFMPEWLPGVKFPSWSQLVPSGTVDFGLRGEALNWSGDDCCEGTNIQYRSQDNPGFGKPGHISSRYLVVTERFLEMLRRHGLEHCEIVELHLVDD